MLDTFVAINRRRPWRPGDVDCLLVLADWCITNGHDDPASHLRGTYHDDAGFEAIIKSAGGVVPLVAGCAERIGLSRIDAPLLGSIAVVGSPWNIHKQFGAIWDGRGWLVRFVNEYVSVRSRALAVWGV